MPSDLYRYGDRIDEEAVTLTKNDQPLAVETQQGFVTLQNTWRSGDAVELTLPMPVRRIVSHPKVKENESKVALQRGPIVYCAEGIDNQGSALDIALTDNASLETEWREDFLGGVVVLKGHAKKNNKPVSLMAIPYAVWSNRGAGEMAVWLQRK